MLLIIRLVELSNVLYNNLIILRIIAPFFLIILIIEIRLSKIYIKVKTNKLLII